MATPQTPPPLSPIGNRPMPQPPTAPVKGNAAPFSLGSKTAPSATAPSDEPQTIPTNFAEFKRLYPKLFDKFYKNLVQTVMLQTITMLRKSQAKIKASMKGNI